MFQSMGRMRVEPGHAPVWEGGDKGMNKRWRSRMLNRRLGRLGRDFLENRDSNFLSEVDENIKEDIRKNIEEELERKFSKSNYTEEQKQSIKMTMKAQARVHSRVIFEEAVDRVRNNRDFKDRTQDITDEEFMRTFYEYVEEVAEDIVDNEFDFPNNLDIDKFAERESKIKTKINKGEITVEEAYEILKEPLQVEKDSKKDQKYEEMYEGYRKQEAKNKKRNRAAQYRKSQYVPPEKRNSTNKEKKKMKTQEKGEVQL